MSMEDQDLRSGSPSRQRIHLSAVIASLFASLLLLFGGDVSGRSHPGLFTNGSVQRSDAGQATAGGHRDTRFVASWEQSARPKLRPTATGDGCLVPDIQALWMCRHGHVAQLFPTDRLHLRAPVPYRSRAPPMIPQTV
jgi:hypothetical protein